MYNRIFLIVIDSVGVGEMHDAVKYGDTNSNTIKHASFSKSDFSIPNLQELGIGNLTEINNCPPTINPKGVVTKLSEQSNGKDTTTGHWEMTGIVTCEPFVTFTETGFPDELISLLEEKSGRNIVGNKAASGTEILVELGEHHMKTGDLIVYTSADSVLQIAANEDVIPLDELYSICEIARKITLDKEDWKVGRIIARPFIGDNKDNFTRTTNRHDYSVKPTSTTVLDILKENNLDVISVGKINDIFDGEGITKVVSSKNNAEAMDKIIDLTQEDFKGLLFANLVDFDALYGHRRNPLGYAECLEEFDFKLGTLLNKLKKDDLLIITADHGNDPIHHGTDHTREYVPFAAFNNTLEGKTIANRHSFSDIGKTILANYKIDNCLPGVEITEVKLK